MSTGTDVIVETLKDAGVELLPFNEDMSIPDFPHGSIQWEEFYNHHRIYEKTGYAPQMYADVEDGGVCITSITASKFIPFDADAPKEFVSQIKSTMLKFYLEL